MKRQRWLEVVIVIIALGMGLAQLRACTQCYPNRGSWDPVRGTLCYGEAPP